jgi:hypothetical protein
VKWNKIEILSLPARMGELEEEYNNSQIAAHLVQSVSN